MRYFGQPHEAPVYDEVERAPTPVGRSCLYCEIAIEDGDDGFLIPDLTVEEEGVIAESPWHRDCLLKSILGPQAHLGTPRLPSDGPPSD